VRLFILSQYYDPEPGFKTHLLAGSLTVYGHAVTTITGFPNYPRGKLYPGYKIRWRQWEEQDGVSILRLPLYPAHGRSSGKRVLNYLSFAASACLLGPVLCGSADVMWVYHPPLSVGIPAWWMGLLRRIPFVYEIQDMWPETLAATGMMPSPRVSKILSYLAKFVYERAAAITVISPGFKRNLVSKGIPEKKIHVIPNWADEEIYRPVLPDPELALKHSLTGRFNVIFAGNLGAAQALGNVIKAALLLNDLPGVQFVFIGDGVEEMKLRKTVKDYNLRNVLFMGRQPTEAMPHFFALADVLLVHLKRDPLFEITIPSKTIAYLACGRPIISCVAGDAAELIRGTGAGLICPPENPETLAQSVRDLHAMSAERREAMGKAGRRAFLADYTRSKLICRYENLFTSVVKEWKNRKTSPEKRG